MEKVVVSPWGNSQAIRLPKAILDKLKIKSADTLQIEVIDNSIVLKKCFVHKTLKHRIDEYNGKIEVCEFDWGEPVGKEML